MSSRPLPFTGSSSVASTWSSTRLEAEPTVVRSLACSTVPAGTR